MSFVGAGNLDTELVAILETGFNLMGELAGMDNDLPETMRERYSMIDCATGLRTRGTIGFGTTLVNG